MLLVRKWLARFGKHELQFFKFYSTKENDIFALGLVFLEAATLQSFYDLYDWDKRVLDMHQIKEKL